MTRRSLLLATVRLARRALPALALLAAAPGVARAQSPEDPRALRALESLEPAVRFTNLPTPPRTLADRMEWWKVPAVSVAVLDDGGVVWTGGFGRTRAGDGEPVDAGTLFAVKSISKPVAAAVALDLVEDGLLALDEPLAERLVSWRIPENEHTRATAPTLRHVLSHRAGFTRGGVDSYRPDEPRPTLLQSLSGTGPAEDPAVDVHFEPGTATHYSGGGYGVLQALIEDVTGKSFSEVAAERVFEPLGMESSAFFDGALPDSALSGAALGHDSDGEPYPAGGYEILPIQTAGGMWSTAEDLARFVREIQASVAGRSDRVLDPATAREMTAEVAEGWGLGVEVEDRGGTRVFRHTGSGDGFKAVFVAAVEGGWGAVVLANGDGAGALRYEILRALAREYGWPGFDGVVEYEVADVPEEELRSLAGRYVWSSGIDQEVEWRDGALWTRFGRDAWQRLYPLGDGEFVTSSDERYRFEDGRLLYVQEDGTTYTAGSFPRGWTAVADAAGAGEVRFVTMTPGWHLHPGPAGVVYRPSRTAEAPFRIEMEALRFPGEPSGYGVFLGGRGLEPGSYDFLEVLLDARGRYRVGRRVGSEYHEIVPWTEHEAIAVPASDGPARNVLVVEARPDRLVASVNGIELTSIEPPSRLDGVAGLRGLEGVDLHLSRLDVVPAARRDGPDPRVPAPGRIADPPSKP